ncbi:phage tail tape measure protein [Roseovarius sp. MMSF_3281]|uniref:phage tail tape measure protein n=1 Tax=Roseovarius sp. MMSF_3281 TaxID=3046694 RepID=UPI00273FE41E|nr:phage tail tape measure protein [Roseovarius sp. MMSF_3281]
MAAIGGGVRTLADFEKQMSTVGAVSRASADELAAMRDIAADLGSTTEFTAKQAGQGLEFLARAGFSASEAVEAIPAVLDLATASAMGLGSAADISSNIMSAFAIEAENSAAVADVLAAASSRANTDVQQLGDAMSYVGPVASSLEVSMSDAAAAIGVLSDAGIQGSMAGTSLRRVLSSLANPTKDAVATLRSLGLEMENLNPQTNDLTEIVQRLSDAGLSAADALTVFGDRGGPAILALTSQTGRLEELTGALMDVEGESARMADTMRDNLGGDIDSLWSSIQGLIIALGDAGLTAVVRGVIKTITMLARGITTVVDAVADFGEAIGDLVRPSENQHIINEALEAGFDNITIAIGDQMVALEKYQKLQAEGVQMSTRELELMAAKLRARREEILAIEEERRALALQSERYQGILDDIQVARDALNSVRIADAEQYENAEQHLVDMLNRQKQFIADLGLKVALTEEEQAAMAEINAALAEINGKIEDRNNKEAQGVKLSERIAAAFNLTADAIGETSSRASLLVDTLDGVWSAAASIYDALSKVVGLFRTIGAGLSALSPALGMISQSTGALGTVIKSVVGSEAVAGLSETLGDVGSKLSRMHTASVEAAGGLKRVETSAGGASKAAKKLGKDLPVSEAEAFNEALEDAAMTAEDFGKAKAQTLIRGIDDVSHAWAGFISSGFKDFKGFVSSVWDAFKGLLVNMIALAARNKIMIGLGLSGGGVAGAASAATGGVIGGGGGVLGGLSNAGGLLGSIGGIGSALVGGLTNTIGATISGGLGMGLASIGGQISTAIAAPTLTSIAGAIGAAAPVIGAVAVAAQALTKAFSRSYYGSGVRGSLGPDGADVQSFDFYKGGAFKSSKTVYKPLEEEMQRMLDDTSTGLADTVRNMADTLGLASEAIDDFTGEAFTIWASGPHADKLQENLQNELNKLAVGMADRVLTTDEFSRAGETSFDTLERLSNALSAVNGAFDTLGLQLKEIGLAGADAASSFIDLFGGLDQFNASVSSYYQNFYSDAERTKRATEVLTEELNALGIDALPKSRAAFRALVDEANALGDDELTAALIQLAPAFAQITDGADALTNSLLDSPLYRTSADAIYANTADGYRANIQEIRDAEETKDLLKEVVRAIREGNINNARLSDRLYQETRRGNLESQV